MYEHMEYLADDGHVIGPLKLFLEYNDGAFAWRPQLSLEAPPLSLEAPPLPAVNTTLDRGSQPSCDLTPGLPPEESSGAGPDEVASVKDPPPGPTAAMPAQFMSIISPPRQSISRTRDVDNFLHSQWLSDAHSQSEASTTDTISTSYWLFDALSEREESTAGTCATSSIVSDPTPPLQTRDDNYYAALRLIRQELQESRPPVVSTWSGVIHTI